MDVSNKLIAITGAVGGIGLPTAKYLAAAGARLSLSDSNDSQVESVAKALSEEYGVKVFHKTVDVRSRVAVEAWITETTAFFGTPLDGAVNLAGVCSKDFGIANIWEIDDDDFDFTIAVNLKGVLNSMRAEIPNMRDGGSIINASSYAGLAGFPKGGAYVASKHAVLGLSRSAAKELGSGRGIRVNAICPGVIDTQMLSTAMSQAGDGAIDLILGQVTAGRKGRPEEVASVIAFLLSDASRYVTGASQTIDGGWFC
ncbi:3-alpha--hydroxysteroid dehydrogenase [Thozetella sp. PMI_491]|nr:3-alpha--hydroxysteroid dehydrogenase [Thozetella sp. PMI_491]